MTLSNIIRYERTIACTIESLANEIWNLAKEDSKNSYVVWRIKNPETLSKKMLLKNSNDIFLIDDIYGIRVLVDSVQESYDVLGKIQSQFPGFIDHDYIATPKTKPNKPHLTGKSLRLLQFIAYRKGVPFEIQITTKDFNECNEKLHKEYHQNKYK